MLRREGIVFEYQEVCILSRSDGALFVLYAELYSAVDGIAQEHFVDAPFFILEGICGFLSGTVHFPGTESFPVAKQGIPKSQQLQLERSGFFHNVIVIPLLW